MKSNLRSSVTVFIMLTAVLLLSNAVIIAQLAELDFEIEEIHYIYSTKPVKEIAILQMPATPTLKADRPFQSFQTKPTGDCSVIRNNLQKIYCIFRE